MGVVPAHAHDDSSFHPSENASQSMAKNGLEINTYTMLDLPTEKVHSVNVDLPVVGSACSLHHPPYRERSARVLVD